MTIERNRSVDRYIEGFPPDVREKLEELKRIVRREAPEAVQHQQGRGPLSTRPPHTLRPGHGDREVQG